MTESRESTHEFDGASVPELMEHMRDAEPSRRADAACALGDRLRCREIRQLDGAVLDRLAELLGDDVPMVQFEAAMAMAEARDHRATELLLLAMRHRMFRLDAIRALGTMGDPRALEPLRATLRRRLIAWADRLQAAAALCALADETGARYLEARLTSRRRAERAAALHFIGESSHPDALAILGAHLRDPDESVREVAARSLGFLGGDAAAALLSTALDGAGEGLRQDIEEALARIKRGTTR